MSSTRLPGIEELANWSITDVAEWLKKLKCDDPGILAFQDNYIDGVKLAGLTEEDLCRMPTVKLKYRKVILKQIIDAKSGTNNNKKKPTKGFFSKKAPPTPLPAKTSLDSPAVGRNTPVQHHADFQEDWGSDFEDDLHGGSLSPSIRPPPPLPRPGDDTNGDYDAPDVIDSDGDSDDSYEKPDTVIQPPVHLDSPSVNPPFPSPRLLHREPPPPLPEEETPRPPPARPPKSNVIRHAPQKQESWPSSPPPVPSHNNFLDDYYIAPDIKEEPPKTPVRPQHTFLPPKPGSNMRNTPSPRTVKPPVVVEEEDDQYIVPGDDNQDTYEAVVEGAQIDVCRMVPTKKPHEPIKSPFLEQNKMPVNKNIKKNYNETKSVDTAPKMPHLPIKRPVLRPPPTVTVVSETKDNTVSSKNNDTDSSPTGGIAARIAALNKQSSEKPPIGFKPKDPVQAPKEKSLEPVSHAKGLNNYKKPNLTQKPGGAKVFPPPPTNIDKSSNRVLPSPPPSSSSGHDHRKVSEPTPPRKTSDFTPPRKASEPNLPSHVRNLPEPSRTGTPPALPNRPPGLRRLSESSETGHRSLPAPPTPQDQLERLYSYGWYHGELARKETEKRLKSLYQEGTFLVRKSQRGGTEQPYSLSMYYNDKVWHLPIRRRTDGSFALGSYKSGEEAFNNVPDLISFHQSNMLLLSGSFGGQTKLTLFPKK